LHPVGQVVKGGGATDGDAELSHDYREGGGPRCGAMHFAGRPEVVGDEEQQEEKDEGAVEERAGGDEGVADQQIAQWADTGSERQGPRGWIKEFFGCPISLV